MSHPIVHVELSAHNHKEAARFYTDIFGWQVTEMPEMNYVTFSSGEGAPGGGFNLVQEGNPAGTTVLYITTDDIAATMAKIETYGGKRLAPDIEIPDVGTIAPFSDPTGNYLSLLKPAESM